MKRFLFIALLGFAFYELSSFSPAKAENEQPKSESLSTYIDLGFSFDLTNHYAEAVYYVFEVETVPFGISTETEELKSFYEIEGRSRGPPVAWKDFAT